MQPTSGPLDSQQPRPLEHARRSASGASTNSQESAMTHDLSFGSARYAPIRPMSQPIGQPQEGFPIAVQSFEGDHSALQQIHQYNTSQNPMVHPHVAAFQTQAQFAPYDGPMPTNGFHAMSEGPPDSRPGSRHRGPSVGSVQLPGTDGDTKSKKHANANAANERELRELIEKNQHRSLDSIAKDVRGAERTQKAERAKQLFAMRWLKQFCRIDKESVPRNRVYTYYTQRCGSERVDTLNPASFGKLVRVIFPGIQTRRLGVRGESKYHYVNLSLVEDTGARSNAPGRPSSAGNNSAVADREQSLVPDQPPNNFSHAPADSMVFQPQLSQTLPDFNSPIQSNTPNPSSSGQLFADPASRGFHHDLEGPQMYEQQLRFSSATDLSLLEGALEIPNIRPFLPQRADIDLADNLEALYRTHCTSLIDAVRYVKEKSFFKLLTGFNGQMTVPVSKLFQHPRLAPWIKQCDLIMYRQIIKFVSQLALQVIPPQVFNMLGHVSDDLTKHMRANFKNFPDHVLQAKLEPAVVFSSLLKRLIRVNETAHAAANLLMNDHMRNLMWQDWVRSVKPKRVVESELPSCGQQETYNVLTREVRQLLEPLQPSDWSDVEVGPDFEDEVFMSANGGSRLAGHLSAEGIIDRWAVFLKSLPARFSTCPTRTLLYCINSVGTAALRDITVSQAQSFGGWWITKVWVDEMMLWLAESGGFLDPEYQPVPTDMQGTSFDGLPEQISERDSRPTLARSASTGLGINFQTMPTFEPPQLPDRPSSGPPTATFRLPPRSQSKHGQLSFDMGDHHDDSGIGMSLLDDTTHGHSSFMSAAQAQDDFASLLS